MSAGADAERVQIGPLTVSRRTVNSNVERFRMDGTWPGSWGPSPDEKGCRVPPHLLGARHPAVSFSGGRPRVTFHVLDGIRPSPPRQDIVEGLFQAGELVTLIGAPKAGKSALAVHLTHAVASGAPFLGRVTRRGAVAYLALERDAETVRRLRTCGDGLPILVSGDHPSFGEADDVAAVMEALEAASAALPPDLPLRLIIVDTARKAFRGLRENDADSVSLGMDALRRVMRAVPTAALVLVHHLSKDGSSARGSGAILADADIEITVFNRSGRRNVEVTGANAVEEGQELPFELVLVPISSTETVITVRPAALPLLGGGGSKAASRQAGSGRLPGDALTLLRLLADAQRSTTFDEWHQAGLAAFADKNSGARRQAWSKWSRELIERGLVTRSGEGPDDRPDDIVSVSGVSAERQRIATTDGAKASARGVSAPPSIRGGADVADTPDRPARERRS